jgi:hypothetical protein
MSQRLATNRERFRRFLMAPGYSMRHNRDMKTTVGRNPKPSWYGDPKDIKTLVAEEVRRQSDAEQQREFMKEVKKGRREGPPAPAVLSWGIAGAVPAPQRIDDETFRRTTDGTLDPRQLGPSALEQAAAVIPAPPPQPARRAPGRKPGGAADAKAMAWHIAERILRDPACCPARGHGRVMNLARLVKPEMEKAGHMHNAETIAGQIRRSLRDWERRYPLL